MDAPGSAPSDQTVATIAAAVQAAITPLVAPIAAELAASRHTSERQMTLIAEQAEQLGRLRAENAWLRSAQSSRGRREPATASSRGARRARPVVQAPREGEVVAPV